MVENYRMFGYGGSSSCRASRALQAFAGLELEMRFGWGCLEISRFGIQRLGSRLTWGVYPEAP